ncbi:MAG: hypothetical protein NPINA01_23110 [Nitrospinaceae bacterium]|nr:MAG: hypothetical protein NPINA01_23110 [Nitrospinaceae bacterium]
MSLRKLIIFSLISFSLILSSTVSFAIPGQERIRSAEEVDPWFVEGMNEAEMILAAGETAYCNKNFTLENLSQELAQVQVIKENGAIYHWDRLEPNERKEYSLNKGSDYSFPNASGVTVDEARIINSTTGETSVKVVCQ